MNTNKFNDNDVLVVVMNVFLKLISFSIIAIMLFPLFYVVGGFTSNLINFVMLLLGINTQIDWVSFWLIVICIVGFFYLITGRYKSVYFRSWSGEDRDGYYQDFELHL